jgi:lipopolysaccharide/colanic/teichoic acid biosynthesis glycosyltransferase
MKLLFERVARIGSGIVAVSISMRLRGGSEKVLTDSHQNLVGFRPLYVDVVQPAPIPFDWPHHLFVRSDVAEHLFSDRLLPVDFNEFLSRCRSASATIGSISVGGAVLDLNTESGLLSLLLDQTGKGAIRHCNYSPSKQMVENNSISISPDVRLFGEIAFGQNVSIGTNAIVAGPALIGDNVKIGDNAVIQESIIGSDVLVPPGLRVQGRVIVNSSQIVKPTCGIIKSKPDTIGCFMPQDNSFSGSCYKTWPKFSYATCIKRIADIMLAASMLAVFAPVLPVIAFMIKFTSKGPVFFRHMRQGLHGRSFACLKFRTMLVGADNMQEKLRALNEADGPQFVIADDPRISKVGRFLRETYLDEIPQFLSVLLGHMSIVGPRPSPESENVSCPFWRDARLSVRPGLTGLWQVCRTRQPMKDFQEWIHYDIEYVRNLSIKLDLWICWQTAKKMFTNFVRQF